MKSSPTGATSLLSTEVEISSQHEQAQSQIPVPTLENEASTRYIHSLFSIIIFDQYFYS